LDSENCSGNLGGNAQRSRHALNADTIREMHLAFRRGGRKAIDKVMRNKPDIFLKLLVLLVPREMKVEHTGGVKSMTDEQLEQGIEAITAMLAARDAGSQAKVERDDRQHHQPKHVTRNSGIKRLDELAACLLRPYPSAWFRLQKCHKGQVLAAEYCPGNGQQVAY
jgi:hypothetical protein